MVLLPLCCFPHRYQLCYPKQRMEMCPGLGAQPELEIHHASCPNFQKSSHYSHHKPKRSSLLRDKRQHRDFESVPGQQCPISGPNLVKIFFESLSMPRSVSMIHNNKIQKTMKNLLAHFIYSNLHSDKPILHLHFFCEKVRTDGGLVLVAEFL